MADQRRAFPVSGLAGLCTLGLLVTACGSHVEGIPLPPAAVTSSDTPNHHGAPPVPHPVDASHFLAKPCAALTPAQLQTLRLDGPGKAETSGPLAEYAGPACSWRNAEPDSVTFSFMTGNKNGLADIYRGHDQGLFPGYWIETTVDSLPAVYASDVDGRSASFCSLHTGISDTLEILVDESLHAGKDACEGAKQTTSLIIKTLRGG